MSKKRPVTSRDLPGLHAVDLFESVYNQANLDNSRATRILRRKGELANGFAKLLTDLAMSSWYADEELNSECLYSEKYHGPRPIDEQITALAAIFNFDHSHALKLAKHLPELPHGAEGWFAVLDWKQTALTYCEVLEKVLAAIKSKRNFFNHQDGRLGAEYLRQHARTTIMLQKFRDQYGQLVGGGILIVPAQLGMWHRGRSVRRSHAVFARHEFGLDAVAVGSILLTHPELQTRWEHLQIDCAGNEYALGNDGGWQLAPSFHFASSLKFGVRLYNFADKRYGSATGFLPPRQQPQSPRRNHVQRR